MDTLRPLERKEQGRTTRSRSRAEAGGEKKAAPDREETDALRTLTEPKQLPETLNGKITGLSPSDLAILRRKQKWLRSYRVDCPVNTPKVQPAIDATMVFAQEEAGTAVCIASQGLLLTCSHCVAEDEAQFDPQKSHWLLFASGRVVETRCIAWDGVRDLALLEIVAAQASSTPFPHVSVAAAAPSKNARLACIGHPGSEDLETTTPGIKTNYDVLHVSVGRFRGHAAGQSLQDNSEIGALKHDCWTYWGHSGAPLVDVASGAVVGLHSSWDDQTGMRRGVAWEAINEFVQRHGII